MQTADFARSAEASASAFPIPANVYAEKVVSVTHYTDRLFSFRVTRPQSFRFRSGEFVMIGLLTNGRLTYYASTTRGKFPRMGRVTTLIEDGTLFTDIGAEPFDPANDRVMICGSMAMLHDVKALVGKAGFAGGSHSAPGDF